MEIIQIPYGETKESFLKCRILNIERILELYSALVYKDSSCFDEKTDVKIQQVFSEITELKNILEAK